MNIFVFFYCYLFLLPIYSFPFFPHDWKNLKLKWIRKNIDIVDDGIYHLIHQRTKLAKNLKGLKPTVRDPFREVFIVSRLQKKKKLDTKFVKNVWVLFFKESYSVQEMDEI